MPTQEAVERAVHLKQMLVLLAGEIISNAGPEAAAVILRGVADRVEAQAKALGKWNPERYAATAEFSAAAQMASDAIKRMRDSDQFMRPS